MNSTCSEQYAAVHSKRLITSKPRQSNKNLWCKNSLSFS